MPEPQVIQVSLTVAATMHDHERLGGVLNHDGSMALPWARPARSQRVMRGALRPVDSGPASHIRRPDIAEHRDAGSAAAKHH